ncbi:hypothetical protein [Sulfitobacter noctilucicola]|nr:hypothetical protein [Sulfitobacter noctilucicola]
MRRFGGLVKVDDTGGSDMSQRIVQVPKSSKMPELAIGAAYLAIGALFIGVFTAFQMPLMICVTLGLTLVFAATALLIDKYTTADWIISALSSAKPPTAYNLSLDFALPRLRAALTISEPREGSGLFSLLSDVFTYRLLDRAMLIAVAYPVLLLLLYWALVGQGGFLGEVQIIPPADAYWKGPATLGGVAMIFLAYFSETRAAVSPKRFVRSVSSLLGAGAIVGFTVFNYFAELPTGAFAVAVAFAIAGAVAFAFAGAVAVAIAVAFAFAVAGTVAFAGAVAGTVAIAIAVAVAVAFAGAVAGTVAFAIASAKLIASERTKTASLLAIGFPSIGALLVVWLLPWEGFGDSAPLAATVLLFLGILPVLNALFDTVSYGVTLALAERGRNDWALLWGLADAAVAMTLFLALGAVLVVVISGMEALSGVPFADLNTLLTQRIGASEYWWLYAMLFSTALPTVLHLCLACLSLQALLPLRWRNGLCGLIRRAHEGVALDGVAATFLLGSFFTLGLAVPLLLIYWIGVVFWSSLVGPFLYGYQSLLFNLYGLITG